MKLNDLAIIGVTAATVMSCTPSKKDYASYELYPVRSGSLTEMVYAPEATCFTLWAPTADEVRLMLFESGHEGNAYQTVPMNPAKEGTWEVKVDGDLKGKFYAFNVNIDGKWQGDTPGITAYAVGVNGKRGAIIDLDETDPEGWADDVRPALKSPEGYLLQRSKTLELLKNRLIAAQNQQIHMKSRRYVALTAKLDAMSPLKVLTRGYAMAQSREGQVIKSVLQIQPGDAITLQVSDGKIDAYVTGTQEESK